MTTETTAQQREAEIEQEIVEALTEELNGHTGGQVSRSALDERAEALLNTIGPQLAAIRRHAAAEALKAQAARLGAVNSQYIKQLKHYEYDSNAYRLTYARAGQALADAARLRNAARDIIAEGWEFTCYATWAATRDDPGYGCDAPVESEGDYCDRHEPADDYDPSQDD